MLAATCVPGVSLPLRQDPPPDMNGDSALAGKILRKRQEEMARRAALSNPKARRNGADVPALATQMDEKQIMAAAAAEAEANDDQIRAMQDKVVQAIEDHKANFRREQQKATVQYSLQNLNKESRREYDLSDPDQLKKQRLPKDGIGSDGREIGAAAMQNFEGEVDIKELQRRQRAMQKEWLKQQMEEKQMREQAERDAEKMEAMETLNNTKLREAIEAVEAQEGKQELMEMVHSNLQMAAETQARKQMRKEKEAKLNAREVGKLKNDERLNEVHDWKLNSMGHLSRDEYKRLTYEQVQDVYDANASIILEKQAAKRMELAADLQNDSEVNAAAALMEQLHGLADAQKKERLVKMVSQNRESAGVKTVKDAEEKASYMSWSADGVAPRTTHG